MGAVTDVAKQKKGVAGAIAAFIAGVLLLALAYWLWLKARS